MIPPRGDQTRVRRVRTLAGRDEHQGAGSRWEEDSVGDTCRHLGQSSGSEDREEREGSEQAQPRAMRVRGAGAHSTAH